MSQYIGGRKKGGLKRTPSRFGINIIFGSFVFHYILGPCYYQ